MNPVQLPLIVITDPGEDVDDSFALLLTATSRKYSLQAVISANEDLDESTGIGKVACYAKRLLAALGREDVAVYQGESCGKNRFLCMEALEGLPTQDCNYLAAVKQLAEKHSKIAILSISAMTPLSRIVQAPWFDPSKFEIYQMGGSLSANKPEYNIKCDINAAQMVFRSGAKIHLITSDAAFQEPMQLKVGNKVLEQVFTLADQGISYGLMVRRNYENFLRNFAERNFIPYLSDALAFSAMEEGFVPFTTRKIEVLGSGLTVESDSGAQVRVSQVEVDCERFLTYLQQRMQTFNN